MLTILIVEDNIQHAKLIKSPLQKLQPNAEIIICQSGEEAYEYIIGETKKIDMFFLDWELPGMNGFALADTIRGFEKYRFTDIVFVTGHLVGEVQAFRQIHCYHYIVKPFTEEYLMRELKDLLNHIEKKKSEPLSKVLNLKTRKDQVWLTANEIFFIAKNGRGCLIYTENNIFDIPRVGLDQLIEEIGDKNIIRCHKSFALNLNNVVGIEKIDYEVSKAVFKKSLSEGCFIGDTLRASVVAEMRKLKNVGCEGNNHE